MVELSSANGIDCAYCLLFNGTEKGLKRDVSRSISNELGDITVISPNLSFTSCMPNPSGTTNLTMIPEEYP